MGALHKFVRNYTLPLAAVVLVAAIAGVFVGFGLLGLVSAELNASIQRQLGSYGLWMNILGLFGILVGGWYVGEQLWNRRKFERLLNTDKRSEFTSSRKNLEDIARRLPDRYRPRIEDKEATFKTLRR
jgi:hypothetical protein